MQVTLGCRKVGQKCQLFAALTHARAPKIYPNLSIPTTFYVLQEHYDNFFEDCFVEAEEKYGEIEEMNVCDNLGDHLVSKTSTYNIFLKQK